mgnify:CR=1 FL=1
MITTRIHDLKVGHRLGFVTMTLALIVSFPESSYADSMNRGCLEHHLREARAVNELRKPLYGNVTNGQSFEISHLLIQHESVAIFWGNLFYNFDRWAIPYQRLGVNIVCDDFVSMENTPQFIARRKGPSPSIADFHHPSAKRLKQELRKSMTGGFKLVERKADSLIAELNSLFPLSEQMNCMTRHLLESIRQIARNAPIHVAEHRRLDPQSKLKSPAWISEKMIRVHLLYLADAEALDRLAAPVQAFGVPIICNDVPTIP